MSTTICFFFYVMCMLPLYLHINKKSDDFIQKKCLSWIYDECTDEK